MTQQTNFIDTGHAAPPPHIDLRGDIRPQSTEAWASYSAELRPDPLPLPPDWTDADLPTDPTGPASPTMLAASWKAGQRAIDAIALNRVVEEAEAFAEDARIRAEFADDTERSWPHFPSYDDGTLAKTPVVTTGATEKPPKPETRYVEGLPHTEPAILPPGVPPGYRLRTEDDYRAPQMVPDAYGPNRSPFSHDMGSASEASDPGDATEAAERTAERDWQALRRWASDAAVYLALIVFGAVGGLAIAAAWMGAHGH